MTTTIDLDPSVDAYLNRAFGIRKLSRRHHKINLIQQWAKIWPAYQIGGSALDLSFHDLTDEALSRIGSKIAADFWERRRRDRRNREIAAWAAAFERLAAE